MPTSVPGDRDCDCSAVIAVSAVSLLLIVTLTTVILTQCLLIIRMRRSNGKADVPVSANEAYALTLRRNPCEEATYELVN